MSYPTPNPIVPLFWPDQSALSNLLDEHEYFSRSDQYYPLRWFNAYIRSPDGLKPSPDSPTNLQVHPRDLLVHFPGPPSDHLNETLSPYLDIVESHKAKWETTLSKMEKAKLIEERGWPFSAAGGKSKEKISTGFRNKAQGKEM